jgi:hypothetical protein
MFSITGRLHAKQKLASETGFGSVRTICLVSPLNWLGLPVNAGLPQRARRIRHLVTLLLVSVVLIPSLAHAKRAAAPKVEPVVYEGVRYTAPKDNGRRVPSFRRTRGRAPTIGGAGSSGQRRKPRCWQRRRLAWSPGGEGCARSPHLEANGIRRDALGRVAPMNPPHVGGVARASKPNARWHSPLRSARFLKSQNSCPVPTAIDSPNAAK